MLEEIETLNNLKQYRTMSRTATVMRVTQSTISKRIKSLEATLQKDLIYQQGRHVLLTEEARLFLVRVMPHVVGIKDAIESVEVPDAMSLDIGFSESILSSWGGEIVSQLSAQFSRLSIIPHAHRGPVVLDKVRSGNYSFGICAGDCSQAKDLMIIPLGVEKMVLVGNPLNKKLPLMSVEPQSETWKSLSRQAYENGLVPDQHIEFFTPIAKLARSGSVRGLVPIGVAKENPDLRLKGTKLYRPIVLVARKSTLLRPALKDFIQSLEVVFSSTLKAVNKN